MFTLIQNYSRTKSNYIKQTTYHLMANQNPKNGLMILHLTQLTPTQRIINHFATVYSPEYFLDFMSFELLCFYSNHEKKIISIFLCEYGGWVSLLQTSKTRPVPILWTIMCIDKYFVSSWIEENSKIVLTCKRKGKNVKTVNVKKDS